MLSPLFPLKLNLIGIALPALTELRVGGLLIGEKNPVKMYCTDTVNWQLLELPAASVAVAETTLSPIEKVEPEAGVLLTVAVEHASVAVTGG